MEHAVLVPLKSVIELSDVANVDIFKPPVGVLRLDGYLVFFNDLFRNSTAG